MAKTEAPRVFGKRMKRDPNAEGHWVLKVHGFCVFISWMRPGYECVIYLPRPFGVPMVVSERPSADAAARDIERKLTQLKKRLERMGA
jgi:hypothetical protein